MALAKWAVIENDSYLHPYPQMRARKTQILPRDVMKLIERLSNTLAWFPYIWISMICFFDGLRWILWKIASIPLNYLISEETLFDILRLGISGVRANTASEFVPYILVVWTISMISNYVLVGSLRFIPWRYRNNKK